MNAHTFERPRIKVYAKKSYGKHFFYPNNDDAYVMAKSMRVKSFTDQQINFWRDSGWKVDVEIEVPRINSSMEKTKRFTFTQRQNLEELIAKGTSKREAASILNMSLPTIMRELNRCNGPYKANEAQIDSEKKIDERNAKVKEYHRKAREASNFKPWRSEEIGEENGTR